MARYDEAFVERFLAPWNRHDVDGALALMTDDCVWEVTRGREPHGTLYTGQTAVRSAIVEAFKALPDVNYQPVRNSFGDIVAETPEVDHIPAGSQSGRALNQRRRKAIFPEPEGQSRSGDACPADEYIHGAS